MFGSYILLALCEAEYYEELAEVDFMNFSILKEITTSIEELTKRMDDIENQLHVMERNEKTYRELNKILLDDIWRVLKKKQPEEERFRYIVKFYNGDYLFTEIKPTKQRMVNGEWQDMEDTK